MYNQPSGYGNQYTSYNPSMYTTGAPQGTAIGPQDQAMLSHISHSLQAKPMYHQQPQNMANAMSQQYNQYNDMGS